MGRIGLAAIVVALSWMILAVIGRFSRRAEAREARQP
jgi:hypothetical protein